MPKLTQSQRSLLNAVATAPLQTVSIDDLDGKPGALTTSARALVRRGLITMVDGEGEAGPILSITPEGTALWKPDTPETDDMATEAVQQATEAPEPEPDSTTHRTTKKATVMDLLSREAGASIAELQIATGWQAHSIRAVLTGLRKDGHTLTRERTDGAPSIYRIVEAHG